MSNDDPTCVNLQIDNADGSNQNNVIGTSRKLRCEIRNDNSDNDTEENIPKYRLISLAANPIMLSQIFNTMCRVGRYFDLSRYFQLRLSYRR